MIGTFYVCLIQVLVFFLNTSGQRKFDPFIFLK